MKLIASVGAALTLVAAVIAMSTVGMLSSVGHPQRDVPDPVLALKFWIVFAERNIFFAGMGVVTIEWLRNSAGADGGWNRTVNIAGNIRNYRNMEILCLHIFMCKHLW